MQRLRIFLLQFTTLFLVSIYPVYAQADFSDCSTDNITRFKFLAFFCRFGNLGTFISVLLPNILIFAGIILLLYIVIAGFKIIKNGGSSEDAGNSKQAITSAIIGFTLIFISYFVIQLIEFLTGIEIFKSGF